MASDPAGLLARQRLRRERLGVDIERHGRIVGRGYLADFAEWRHCLLAATPPELTLTPSGTIDFQLQSSCFD